MIQRLRVADVMTREVVTLAEDDTLADARRCMEMGRIRHLPVVRGERLVGLVTHRDLLAASLSILTPNGLRDEAALFARTPVRELMHDAITVVPETTVREAARIMVERKFGCLPVVSRESEKLLGIVTEADLVALLDRMLAAILA